MGLKSVIGVDHVVVAVRDLDAAAAAWTRLGFTVSPRGLHSAPMGTANYTIMFAEDYLELIGVVAETEQNLPTRSFLVEREGIERTAFTARDAAAGAAELKARGLAAIGPVSFGRPVDLPGGGTTEAKFSVFRWPLDQRPAGMRIFACQHHTRAAVWIPEIQSHANGVTRIVRIELVSPTPKSAADHMATLTDQPVTQNPDGSYTVPSGATRADFVFLDKAMLAKRYPPKLLTNLPNEGAISLVLGTSDMTAAVAALGPTGVAHGGMALVPPSAANGVVVAFVPN
jgi:catechol 2,3-dioxygenase-like lactoylglutathione lyase family enzyme